MPSLRMFSSSCLNSSSVRGGIWPSPKKLEAEYAQLASEKAKFYEQYKEAKEELLKLKTAKQNVASYFREEEPTQQER